VAERGPEALAAGEDQVTEGGEGLSKVGVDGGPSGQLAVQNADDAILDATGETDQARRRHRDPWDDSHQLSSPG
jgi:hypothetical protein